MAYVSQTGQLPPQRRGFRMAPRRILLATIGHTRRHCTTIGHTRRRWARCSGTVAQRTHVFQNIMIHRRAPPAQTAHSSQSPSDIYCLLEFEPQRTWAKGQYILFIGIYIVNMLCDCVTRGCGDHSPLTTAAILEWRRRSACVNWNSWQWVQRAPGVACSAVPHGSAGLAESSSDIFQRWRHALAVERVELLAQIL